MNRIDTVAEELKRLLNFLEINKHLLSEKQIAFIRNNIREIRAELMELLNLIEKEGM